MTTSCAFTSTGFRLFGIPVWNKQVSPEDLNKGTDSEGSRMSVFHAFNKGSCTTISEEETKIIPGLYRYRKRAGLQSPEESALLRKDVASTMEFSATSMEEGSGPVKWDKVSCVLVKGGIEEGKTREDCSRLFRIAIQEFQKKNQNSSVEFKSDVVNLKQSMMVSSGNGVQFSVNIQGKV